MSWATSGRHLWPARRNSACKGSFTTGKKNHLVELYFVIYSRDRHIASKEVARFQNFSWLSASHFDPYLRVIAKLHRLASPNTGGHYTSTSLPLLGGCYDR